MSSEITAGLTLEGLTADPKNDPAAKLLVEAAVGSGEKILIVECGCGALALHFAAKFKQVIAHNILFQNDQSTQKLLAEKSIQNVEVKLDDLPRVGNSSELSAGSFDALIFRLGRGTALVNTVIEQAFLLLKDGGHFWVSGHNQEGIKSFAKRAESQFGNQQIVKIKSSCRLLKYVKTSTSIDLTSEATSQEYFSKLELEFSSPSLGVLKYRSKPGIFSYRSTDLGTQLFLKYFPTCEGLNVLDLGCGSGILSLAAFRMGAKSLLALDANVIATQCTADNFKAHGVPGQVQCTNLTDGVTKKFMVIVSNPPFHHGKETDFSFPGKILDSMLKCFEESGTIYLVANRFLNYSDECKKRSLNLKTLADENGYRVYQIQRMLNPA